MRRALIVIDVQNDFLPGGALAVPHGDQVIPVINSLMDHFDSVIATQDWHPADHGSFASQHNKQPGEHILLQGIPQILWPDHCVQGTPGAAFSPLLRLDRFDKVFRKGTDRWVDSYSAFYDMARKRSTGLTAHLKAHQISHVYLAGLALDYCVKYSVLDALSEGFTSYCILDACRGINLSPNDGDAAVQEMRSRGAKIITSQELAPGDSDPHPK